MMRRALFISPHLDDAAFSCGGTLVKLARAGWHTHLCTIFTASVRRPTGFALQCQTDKGLAADVDYMRLRRAEDTRFADVVEVNQVSHLPFKEAPHRGYESAAELFGNLLESDVVWSDIVDELQAIVDRTMPQLIFAPQGLGNHVDHQQTIRAVLRLHTHANICWYRDTPYAIRDPLAQTSQMLPTNVHQVLSDITSTLETKINAINAYTTQLGFQFGGAERMRQTLNAFHEAEARRTHTTGAVERFLCAETTALMIE